MKKWIWSIVCFTTMGVSLNFLTNAHWLSCLTQPLTTTSQQQASVDSKRIGVIIKNLKAAAIKGAATTGGVHFTEAEGLMNELVKIGSPAVRPLLNAYWGSKENPDPRDSRGNIGFWLFEAIAGIGAGVIPDLFEDAKHSHGSSFLTFFEQIFKRIGSEGIPYLVMALSAPEPDLRHAAARTLGYPDLVNDQQLTQGEVVDKLRQLAQRDPDPYTRMYAADALCKLNQCDPNTFRGLVRLAQGADSHLAKMAKITLNRLGPEVVSRLPQPLSVEVASAVTEVFAPQSGTASLPISKGTREGKVPTVSVKVESLAGGHRITQEIQGDTIVSILKQLSEMLEGNPRLITDSGQLNDGVTVKFMGVLDVSGSKMLTDSTLLQDGDEIVVEIDAALPLLLTTTETAL